MDVEIEIDSELTGRVTVHRSSFEFEGASPAAAADTRGELADLLVQVVEQAAKACGLNIVVYHADKHGLAPGIAQEWADEINAHKAEINTLRDRLAVAEEGRRS